MALTVIRDYLNLAGHVELNTSTLMRFAVGMRGTANVHAARRSSEVPGGCGVDREGRGRLRAFAMQCLDGDCRLGLILVLVDFDLLVCFQHLQNNLDFIAVK